MVGRSVVRARGPLRLLAGWATGSSVLAGCYFLTPYDDLTSGAVDAPTVEAGPASDAAVVRDAGPGDAGRTDSGVVTGFCASLTGDAAPTFCDDFDSPPLGATWDAVLVPPEAVLKADPSVFVSPPSSLLLQVPAGASGDESIFLEKQLPAASEVTVGFDFRLDSVPSTDTTYLLQLTMGFDALFLLVEPPAVTLQQRLTTADGSTTFPTTGLSWVPTADWTHAELALTVVASGASMVQVTLGSFTDPVRLDPSWTPGSYVFLLGSTYVNIPTQARAVHFDNLRINAR